MMQTNLAVDPRRGSPLGRNQASRWLLAACAVSVLAAGGAASTLRGCGIDWRRPYSHFDGVDERGYVSHSEQVGDLEIGDEGKLPIYIIFNSAAETSSPILGKGWRMALLESRLEQESENVFRLVQPDGWERMFGRAKASETTLGGQGGWKAEINGERITAWADCGWKLVFERGRIAAMTTPKGQRFDWVYDSSRVSEIRSGAASLLTVRYDSAGQVEALNKPAGKSILVSWTNRPRVRSTSGLNAIAGLDRGVGTLTLVDGTTRGFEYGADDQMQPFLKISAGAGVYAAAQPQTAKTYVWDAASKRIISDGEWTYRITPNANPQENVAVERRNAAGGIESYAWDGGAGREVTRELNGDQLVRTWHTSGKLNGLTRELTLTNSKGAKKTFRPNYDEQGRLIRSTDSSGFVTQYNYANPAVVEVTKHGPGTQETSRYDSKSGQLLEIEDEKGKLPVKTTVDEILKTLRLQTE